MTYKRITFRGETLSQRTADMIVGAEEILGWKLVPTQGSYNRGGVAASAGTHDGGGAVDFSVRGLTSAKKSAMVVALRRVGFSAWHRLETEGDWVEHVHAIAVDDAELSQGAKDQVADYKAGRNGLANNHADNATRLYVYVTWESYQASRGYSGPSNGVAIHTWSLNYATQAKPMSGVTLKDARQFVAFAKSQGLVSNFNEQKYIAHTIAGEWAKASDMFKVFIKSVQRKAGVVVDGLVGPQTGGFMSKFSYKVYYNG